MASEDPSLASSVTLSGSDGSDSISPPSVGGCFGGTCIYQYVAGQWHPLDDLCDCSQGNFIAPGSGACPDGDWVFDNYGPGGENEILTIDCPCNCPLDCTFQMIAGNIIFEEYRPVCCVDCLCVEAGGGTDPGCPDECPDGEVTTGDGPPGPAPGCCCCMPEELTLSIEVLQPPDAIVYAGTFTMTHAGGVWTACGTMCGPAGDAGDFCIYLFCQAQPGGGVKWVMQVCIENCSGGAPPCAGNVYEVDSASCSPVEIEFCLNGITCDLCLAGPSSVNICFSVTE